MSEALHIATVEKNSREEVRVSLDEFRGHRLIDIRVYADFQAGAVNTRCATKKGISLALSKLPDLIAALQEAQAQAEAAGRSGG